jgi:hypothetical protein
MPTRARRSPAVWRRAAAYTRPWKPAAIAITAAGLAPSQALQTTIEQISVDGDHVHHHDGQVSIERPARVYLRALRLHRLSEGAGPSELAFLENNRPITPRRFCDHLATARAELAITVVNGRVERRPSTADTRLARTGITVSEIT